MSRGGLLVVEPSSQSSSRSSDTCEKTGVRVRPRTVASTILKSRADAAATLRAAAAAAALLLLLRASIPSRRTDWDSGNATGHRRTLLDRRITNCITKHDSFA